MKIVDGLINGFYQIGSFVTAPFTWAGRQISRIFGTTREADLFQETQKEPSFPPPLRKAQGPLRKQKVRFDWTPKAKVPSKSAEEFFTVRGKTNPRILFHIHGDMFGDNSELQGSHHEKTYGYLVDYLKTSDGFKLDSAFLRKLEEAHRLTQSPNFSKDAEALTRTAFLKEESVLIPGGWMGKPVGHAVNFELIPEKDGTCTLRIYNLGAGTEHSGVVAEDGKLRGPCYSEWKGIEREKATSPLFFQEIGEMIGFEKAALGQDYFEGDLFGRLKHHLQPAAVIAGVNAPQMSLQQSGVCAWRSLMAVMRTHMPENEYKRFVIQIKLASLKEHCAALIDKEWEKMPREAQNVEYGLITESAKKLARTLAKGVESGTITANFAAKEQKEIATLLSKMESRGMKIPSPFDKPLFTPAGETAPEETPLDTRPLSIKPQSAKATSVDLTPKVERFSSIAACDITDARGLDVLIKACKGADYDDVHVGITDAVKKANLHAFKETTATPEEAQELIIKLGQVSDTYLRSCYCIEGADKIHTDIAYVLRKIAHFQSALSKQAGLEVGYHQGYSFASPLHERFYDPKMRKEMSEMNSSKPANLSPFDHEDEDALLKNTLYQDGFEGSVFQNYEEFLARNHPDAVKAALKKNPSIGSYNRMARSVALFYSSEGPEWFRALRNSALNCDHARLSPISKTSPPDLRLTYDVKPDPSGKRVKIAVTRAGVSKALIEQSENQKTMYRLGVENWRFAAQHRTPRSNALRQFIEQYIRWRPSSEESLITKVKQSPIKGLSEEEHAELLHIFVSDSSQLELLAEYFSKYPEKLSDPDYQTLFSMALFERPAFEEDTEKFFQFLDVQRGNALGNRDIQLYTFLAEMGRRLGVPTEKKTLTDLTLDPALTADERGVVYAALAAHLGEKSTLSDEELIKLAEAKAFIETHPLPSHLVDPHVMLCMDQGVVRHGKAFQSLTPAAVSRIAELCNPGMKGVNWAKSGHCWKSEDGKILYFPLKGRFISPGMRGPIPTEILEKPAFQRLFPKVKEAVPDESGDIWSFKDQNGKETLVHSASSGLIIQQKQKDGWVEYIPPDQLHQLVEGKEVGLLGSRKLHASHPVFRYVDRPSEWILCSPSSGETMYRAQYRLGKPGFFYGRTPGKVLSLTRSDGLQLGKHENDAFENPQFVHYWFEGSTLKEVEYPRFGLTFQGEGLECKELPGWRWNPGRVLPELGYYKDALILEQGSKLRVLLPRQTLYKLDQLETLASRYSHRRADDSAPELTQQYCLFDVDDNGRLKSPKRLDNLQLALAMLAAKNYRRSAKLLQTHGNKLSQFSPEERELCKAILDTSATLGDTTGDASILQCYAGIRLLRDARAPEEKLLQETTAAYKRYLSKRGLASCMSLRFEDELYILKNALAEKFDPLLYNRLAELDPESASRIAEEAPRVETEVLKPADSFKPLSPFDLGEKTTRPEEALLTRPRVLYSHFPYFHARIVAKDRETIEWVKAALPYLAASKGGGSLAKIYLAMLSEPAKFKDWSFEPRNRTSCISELQKIADAIPVDTDTLFPTLETVEPTRKTSPTKAPKAPKVVVPKVSLGFVASWNDLTREFLKSTTNTETYELTSLMNWCREQIQTTGQERLATEAFKARVADVEAFAAEQQKGRVEYKVNDVEGLKESLLLGRQETYDTLHALKTSALKIANKLPPHQKGAAAAGLKEMHKGRKNLTMNALLINYATQRPEALLLANPALTEDDVRQLYQTVADYLILSTHEQQRERALAQFATLEGVDEKSEAYQNGLSHIAETLAAKRSYSPEEHPEYLVFEHAANILMRQQQVDQLAEFMKSGDVNLVSVQIMGSGKSQVLGPLLVQMLADGSRLSTFIVPQQLFESVAVTTQSSIGSAFGQQLKTLHFDRNTTFSALSLEHIRDELRIAKAERQGLIMTSKSMQCLLLKYIEVMDAQNRFGGLDEEAALMTEIIGMINKDITPNLDEVDTLLNVLHEVSFSMGDPTSPEPWETRMTGHLYRMLMEDPSLKKIARLEVDRKPHPEAQPLTKKRYEEKLKPALAEKFIQSLAALDLGDSARNKEVETFAKGLNPQSRTLLLRYLTRDKRNVAETEAFFNKQNESVQDLLALAAEEINGILPHTLTRTVKDNYGVDHESANLFAIPFGGPNVPKKGSQFLSPHVTMAYTYQYYLHEGISVSVVEKLIAQLQSQAMKEVQEGAVSIEATEAWQEFAKLKGDHPLPLFRYTPDQLEGLTNALNRSTEKQCFFVEQFIIPKMEIHPEKISCNPLNLIEFLPRASGFTGTLWNSAGMHRKLNTKQAAGTDAKTLAILWNNSYDKVRRLENTRMETLIKKLGKENVNLIADAGAYFRDATNEEVAKALSEARGMPCVFYNTRNEQAIWIDGRVELLSEVKIPPAERITFLDYSHCTGADVPQKADATGFVTIGPNMLTRDLLQSVWRLRGLADKQKVEFVLSGDVEKLIRDRLSLKEGAPIHFPEILRFTELNQVERQGTDTMKGLNEELAAFQQGLLIRCLISDKLTAEEKSKALKALRSLWIKPAIIPPRKLYGKVATMEDAQKVAKTEGNHAKDTISALIRELPFLAKVGVTPRSASAEIDKIVGHKAPNLPDKVLMPKEVDADQSVEVETSTEQEQEIQVEQEEQTESTIHELGKLSSLSYFVLCQSIEDFQKKIEVSSKYYVSENPAIDLSLFMETRGQMAPVAKAFKGLAVSANMFNWEDRKRAPKIEEMELFGSYRKPFHYLTANGIAVSVAENGTAQNITLDTRNMADQELLRVVQMKFLDGQSRFDKRERALLKEWLKENDVEALKKFYIGQVLNGKPDKAARFQGSDLMRIFLELGTKKAPKKAP